MSVLSVPATYGEAFGLYLIEALAVGVPLVQPRHAAFPEVIEATGGGLLCEPDDPRSLAAAIEELLSDPARARRMGEQGRQVVLERFSIAKMTDDALAVFEQVTRQRREPVPTAS
jgi:glycosyltransferase involved in cell wall biosynthesis